MRISDWSSDVCSSDLLCRAGFIPKQGKERGGVEYDFAHSPDSSRRRARNASTEASALPSVYFFASAWACAIDCATVRKITPSRSDERRVGKEGVSTCRSRWSRYH